MSRFRAIHSIAIRHPRSPLPVETPPLPPPISYRDTVTGLAGGGPLAYWRMSSTTTIPDEIGSLDATVSGTGQALAASLLDQSDEALNFGGAASGSVTHDATLEVAAVSVSFWFQVPEIPAADDRILLVSKDVSGGTLGDCNVHVDEFGALNVRFQAAGGTIGVASADAAVIPNNPYHVCVRADNTGFDAYLNGQYLGKNTDYTGAWSTNQQPFRFAIGAAETTDPCIIDEVAIYSRVLTEANVLELAQKAGNPVANNDAAIVPESATTAIDVLSNDVFVGETPTINIVSQPAGGDSVAVNGTAIDYTAGAVAADTARSFTYSITDANGTSNTATVSVTVQNAGASEPSTFAPICYVESGADTVVVNTMAALVNAVNAAPAGRNILIAAGTYNENFAERTFTGTGTEANPIVIRTQGGRGTVIVNNPVWLIAGQRLVFKDIYFVLGMPPGGGGPSARPQHLELKGQFNRITRCRFRNIGGTAVWMAGKDIRLDHCDMADFIDQRGNRIKHPFFFRTSPGDTSGGVVRRVLVDHNYFHDANPDDAWDGILWGGDPSTADDTIGLDLYKNLFRNIEVAGEIISLKSNGGGNTFIRFNTFDNIGNFYLNCRQCEGGVEFRSNWIEGAHGGAIRVHGDDNLVIGNRLLGACAIRCQAGAKIPGMTQTNDYFTCRDARLIGNRSENGTILIGTGFLDRPGGHEDPIDVTGINLWDNERDGGDPVFDAGAFAGPGVPTQNVDAVSYEPAVKLTPADVGMAAPDPFCPNGPQN